MFRIDIYYNYYCGNSTRRSAGSVTLPRKALLQSRAVLPVVVVLLPVISFAAGGRWLEDIRGCAGVIGSMF
jgi:hypothetical protein